jgi:hypothetical protein
MASWKIQRRSMTLPKSLKNSLACPGLDESSLSVVPSVSAVQGVAISEVYLSIVL